MIEENACLWPAGHQGKLFWTRPRFGESTSGHLQSEPGAPKSDWQLSWVLWRAQTTAGFMVCPRAPQARGPRHEQSPEKRRDLNGARTLRHTPPACPQTKKLARAHARGSVTPVLLAASPVRQVYSIFNAFMTVKFGFLVVRPLLLAVASVSAALDAVSSATENTEKIFPS